MYNWMRYHYLEPGDGTRYGLMVAGADGISGAGSLTHVVIGTELGMHWSYYPFARWSIKENHKPFWNYAAEKLGIREYNAAMIMTAAKVLLDDPDDEQEACERMMWVRNTEFLLKSNIVAKRYPFFVCEWSSGFDIHLGTKSEVSHWMSDGVDMFTNEYGGSVDVGSKEFYEYLNAWLEDDYDLMEAYFPEEAK